MMKIFISVILNEVKDLILEKTRCRNKFGMTREAKGFTLIELMVVISISAVLGTLGIAGFATYNQIQVLQSSANDLATTLNLAKSRAQSQIKPQPCSSRALKGYKVTVFPGIGGNRYRMYAICSDDTNLAVCVGTGGNNNGNHPVDTFKYLPQNIVFDSATSPTAYCFPTLIGGVKTEAGGAMPVGGGKIILKGFGRTKTITVDSIGGVSIQ